MHNIIDGKPLAYPTAAKPLIRRARSLPSAPEVRCRTLIKTVLQEEHAYGRRYRLPLYQIVLNENKDSSLLNSVQTSGYFWDLFDRCCLLNFPNHRDINVSAWIAIVRQESRLILRRDWSRLNKQSDHRKTIAKKNSVPRRHQASES